MPHHAHPAAQISAPRTLNAFLTASFIACTVVGMTALPAFAMQSANCAAGTNHLTSASTAAQVSAALALAGSGGAKVTANATGMTPATLGTLGLNANLLADEGVFGTFTLSNGLYNPAGTSDPLALGARITGLLTHTCEGATVTINAAGMNIAAVTAVCTQIAKADVVVSLAADKTLLLTAAETNGKSIAGLGTVAIRSDALTGFSDLTGVTTTNLTFPSSAPRFSIALGGQLRIAPARVSGQVIEGAGSIALVGDFALDTSLVSLAPAIVLDLDGSVGASIALGRTLTLTAAQANGQVLTGGGTAVIFGAVTADADFTGVESVLDLAGSVDAGAKLTLRASQAHLRAIAGAGTVAISAATSALSTDTDFRSLTTAALEFDGSIAATRTLAIRAAQHTITVNGLGTVDILGTTTDDLVLASSIHATRVIRTLEGNDTLTGGTTDDTLEGGAHDDTILGGAGIDRAMYNSSMQGALASSGVTLTVTTTTDGSDSVRGVERIVFSDATVAIVGRAESAYASLTAALAATSSEKLYGDLAFDASNVVDAAGLNAILARVVAGSSLSANLLGMSDLQIAALNTRHDAFQSFSNAPIAVERGGSAVGHFTSIASSIAFAADGDTVRVAAGNYSESLLLSKRVALVGAGSGLDGTVLTAASALDSAITIANTSAADGRVVVSNLRIVGAASNAIHIANTEPLSRVTVESIVATGMERGLHIAGSAAVNDLLLNNAQFSSIALDAIRVAPTCPSLTNAIVSNTAIVGSGSGHGLIATGAGAADSTIGLALDGVIVTGTVDAAVVIEGYPDAAGVSCNALQLHECISSQADLIFDSTALLASTLHAGNSTLKSILVTNLGGINAEGAQFYTAIGSVLDRSVLAKNFAIADQIHDAIDESGRGLIRFTSDKLYVSAATATGGVERAIAASRAGDTIVVQDGVLVALTAEITGSILFAGNFVLDASSFPADSTADTVLSSFLSRATVGATFRVSTTGMSNAQLCAIASHYTSFGSGVSGELHLTSAQTAAQLDSLLAGAVVGSVLVDGSGMIGAQLDAVAAHPSQLAPAGLTGTLDLSSAILDTNLNALFSTAADSAIIRVNAEAMTATGLSEIAARIAQVDELFNLTLTSAQSPQEISILLGHSVAVNSAQRAMARAVATGMDTRQLAALAGTSARLAESGIEGSLLVSSGAAGLTDAAITALFSKTALAATVRVDASAMLATTLSIIATHDLLIDSIFGLTVTNAQTNSELALLLGKSDVATAQADATGMDSELGGKLATLAAHADKFVANGIGGAIVLNGNLSAAQLSAILSKANIVLAFVDAATITIDALAMSDAQLDAIAEALLRAGSAEAQAAIFDLSNLTLTQAQSAAQITTLLHATLDGEATVHATGMNQLQLAAIADAGAAIGLIHGQFSITAALTAEQIAALMANASTSANVLVDSTNMSAAQLAALFGTAILSVEANTTVAVDEIFFVEVNVSGLPVAAVGVQARVVFDPTKLEFVGGFEVGGVDFPATIFVDAGVDSVAFSTGAALDGSGEGVTSGNAARLAFRAKTAFCGSTDSVALATDGFPCLISAFGGGVAVPFTGLSMATIAALDAPIFVGAPELAGVTVATDAGSLVGAAIIEPIVTASNSCEPILLVSRSVALADGSTPTVWPSVFPIGTSVVEWSVTDASGTITTLSRTYTVLNHQLLTVGVDLVGSINAAISFDQPLRARLSTGELLAATVHFNGRVGVTVDLEVPVRTDYSCLSLKDATHTLADAQPLSVANGKWVTPARFALVSGDSNQDNLIDILDFGNFVSDRGADKDFASRSNYTRDSVVSNGDFGFIALQFLQTGESCGGGNLDTGTPLARVSLKDLRRHGLGHMAQADLNSDGWLDAADMALAMQGQYRDSGAVRVREQDQTTQPRW